MSTEITPGFEALKVHIRENKIDVSLWCMRLFTTFCSFPYFIPGLRDLANLYYQVLIANAAISAMRLHQRQPRMTPSREFLLSILMEDSCHYLIYSLIFLYVPPFPLVLLPIFLFSLIHFASYSITLMDVTGCNTWWPVILLIGLIEYQSRKILYFIALIEILLMPLSIIFLFLSRAGLLTPLLYYQFLVMRYKSLRNPYTKNMFHKLRVILEDFSERPSTPTFVKFGINLLIQFVTRCGPVRQEAHSN